MKRNLNEFSKEMESSILDVMHPYRSNSAIDVRILSKELESRIG
jgi:hypothetical protein